MKHLLTLLFILSGFCSIAQTKVGGVELPNEMVIKEQQMQLHGSGTRVKLWMDMYAMGLYMKNKISDAEQIINKDECMGIRLEITSGLITSEKMEKATREGFKNATKGNITPIAKEIENFISVFLGEIEKKDRFEFVYCPIEGTLVYKNGKLKASIKGIDFKKALFGIWLCDKPADKNLKEDLLK
ncbi:chalcone isomerase family protein [Marinifilum sp. RC60d5]|uniref:chalcone isomerase family protein n=1 Tax=Marinifilum sp. RC60d5 TaxID=3458414 RepID=UPI00403558CD